MSVMRVREMLCEVVQACRGRRSWSRRRGSCEGEGDGRWGEFKDGDGEWACQGADAVPLCCGARRARWRGHCRAVSIVVYRRRVTVRERGRTLVSFVCFVCLVCPPVPRDRRSAHNPPSGSKNDGQSPISIFFGSGGGLLHQNSLSHQAHHILHLQHTHSHGVEQHSDTSPPGHKAQGDRTCLRWQGQLLQPHAHSRQRSRDCRSRNSHTPSQYR